MRRPFDSSPNGLKQRTVQRAGARAQKSSPPMRTNSKLAERRPPGNQRDARRRARANHHPAQAAARDQNRRPSEVAIATPIATLRKQLPYLDEVAGSR